MKATKRSSVAVVGSAWVGALVVAGGVGAVGHWLDDGPRVGGGSAGVVAALGRVERRLNDLEQQFELAMQARAEPAVVERIAEERGIEMDDAWNEYFDGIVTRLERVEARLDGGELPDGLSTDEGQLAFAQRIAPLILGARRGLAAKTRWPQMAFGDMSGNPFATQQSLFTGLQSGRFQLAAEGVTLTIGGAGSVPSQLLILASQAEANEEETTNEGETGSAPSADGDQ